MRSLILLLIGLILSACAHSPKCGNPEGAKIILVGKVSCQVRVRQVTIGSDLKIPASLKGVALSEFSLEWIEPDLKEGRIELGHFVLVPESSRKAERL